MLGEAMGQDVEQVEDTRGYGMGGYPKASNCGEV